MVLVFPMSLARAANRWLRNKPSGSIKTWEDLKIKFLSKYCPPARTAKKMEEINNFQQEPNETLYQAWERFKELLMKCPQHYLTEMQEIILFYNGLDVPTRQILDSKGAIPTKTAADAKVALHEMGEYSQKWHNGTSRIISTETSDGLAAIQAQLNNLGREIKKVNEKGASIKTLEIQIRKMSKVLQERGFGSLPSSTETNLRDHVKSISTAVKADMTLIRRIGSTQYAVSAQQNTNSYGALHIDNSIPRKEKDLRSFTLPCYINNVCFDNALADLGARVSVMPLLTYLNLGLGALAHTKLTVELADRTVKYPRGIAENVLVGISKFVFPIDFIILDMPEDVKVPLILGRPFLSTTHSKIDVFKRKITLRVGDEKIIFKSMKPASSLIKRVYMLGLIERMELDLKARLIGETLVLNRSFLYEDYIELNDHNVPLELRRDQVDDLIPTIEEGEVIDEPMIDISKTKNDYVENMMATRDQDMEMSLLRTILQKASCVQGQKVEMVNHYPKYILRVYYAEGLGHNLFFVGQFCDSNLEVAFRQHTCFIRNLEGVDLLTGSLGNNLYTLSLGDMMASSPICLLSKASKTKSWLWHRRLSHLNFGAINHLARHGLVRGLPKLKFEKDHLCSACAMGKSKKKPHKPKSEDTNQEKLYLLHMDLCGPMRVASVNGKKYILVIVDDYSRFT
ncbi:retrovirus-related pol polyprotein from transposon TNT 1-94 [Tanacetum coccineum]